MFGTVYRMIFEKSEKAVVCPNKQFASNGKNWTVLPTWSHAYVHVIYDSGVMFIRYLYVSLKQRKNEEKPKTTQTIAK